MNDRNAGRLRLRRTTKQDRFAADAKFSLSGGIDAGEYFHQGGLASTVLTHQRVHFAGIYVEVNLVQRNYSGEDLGNADHLESAGRQLVGRLCFSRLNEAVTAPDRYGSDVDGLTGR